MIKKILLIAALLQALSGFSQKKAEIIPFFGLTAHYYTSDQVTSDGAGIGAGALIILHDHYLAQVDMNLLWLNGNAVSNRFALGYRLDRTWSPAVFATFGLLWGHRTEILPESGERPPSPVWTAGLRIAPLHFRTKSGFVSALEFGYGFGPSGGRNLEATLLSVGFRF